MNTSTHPSARPGPEAGEAAPGRRTRPGHRLTGQGLPEDKVSLVEIPALAISSTGCRQRVAEGEPIWYLVPDGIVQYIAKRGLYRDGTG